MAEVPQVREIPASIVREIAQAQPSKRDFRQQFPLQQEDLATYVRSRLEDLDSGAAEFAGRMAAALWAMYERAAPGPKLPQLDSREVGALEPVARQLLDDLARGQAEVAGQEFDPEWLIQLRQGPQPHVMGFLIGALRALRLGLSGDVIYEVAVVLLALSGVLEAAAARRRAETETKGGRER